MNKISPLKKNASVSKEVERTEEEKGIDFAEIEAKWQKKWSEKKVFEAEIDSKKEKFFFTTPYPYISGSLHLGHGRAVTESDIYTRYLRMKGLNVLFPLAFHITGTPVLGISAAIQHGDKDKIKLYEGYVGAYEKDKTEVKNIVQSFKDPQKIVDFFIPKMKEEYQQLGLGIDWRRSFTSGDMEHQQMVTWQFEKYRELGFLKKERYPVLYSPQDESAMGEDDIQDADSNPVDKQDFIWIKFKLKGSDLILMAGTTRPDALFGQSNLWIDPEGEYVSVQVGDEKWVVGREAVEKIKYQYKEPKILGIVSPSELIGKWVSGPLVERELYILPAWFIKSTVGSGIVYSALEDPVDLLQLKAIQADKALIKKFNLDVDVVKKLKPIDIISVPGMGSNLGEDIAKEFGVTSFDDPVALEKAKGELNRRVFRKGIMNERCGKFTGKNIPYTQKLLKQELVESGDAVMFYELSREAFSRSGGKIVVAVLDNQWFIDFNAPGWKEKAHECLSSVTLQPETTRKQFEDTFAWLDKRPCARRRGLGTKFPLDKSWIIESLSDSTIYMTLYTINHLVREHGLNREQLSKEFFEYVYLGKGTLKEASLKTKVPSKVLEEMRNAFEYWMPNDQRHTFILHLSNHLSFMIFAHAALFPKKHWPKKISFHGLVLSEGAKMSKSKGNLITLLHVKNTYGADVFRFYMTHSSNIEGTFDWSTHEAENTKATIERVYRDIHQAILTRKKGNVRPLYVSRFNKILKQCTEKIEGMKLREYNALTVFEMLRLVKDAKFVMPEDELRAFYDLIAESWIAMIAPVCPHIAEELWSLAGKKGFVSVSPWPAFNQSLIDEKLELVEQAAEKTISDIVNVLGIVRQKSGKEPANVYLYVVPSELAHYDVQVLSKRTGVTVEVFAVNDPKKHDPEGKSGKAKLGKPGIYVA